MGSYNLSCFVSGVTIAPGDEIYFIPLLKNKSVESSKDFYYMDGTEFFIPASMPIKAIYDDYGSIIPEESEYTKVLVNHLQGNSTYTLADICNSENDFFEGGCYVHKEIYESLFVYLNDFNGKAADHTNFAAKFDLWKQAISYEIEHNKKMIELLKQNPDTITDPEELKYRETEIINCENKLTNFDFGYLPGAGFFSFDTIAGAGRFSKLKIYLKDLYYEKLNPSEIINFINFICNLYSVNKILIPAVLGEQCGNPYMTRKLLNVSEKINQSKIKKVEK